MVRDIWVVRARLRRARTFVAGADGRSSMGGVRADADDASRSTTLGAPTVMSTSAPVATLVILGAVIAVLGLFAAGNVVVTALGLAAVFAAGLLEVATSGTAR
jgi:hypothetical protein